MWLLIWCSAVLLACCWLFYRWYTREYHVWANLGVAGPEPSFPFGNLRSSLLMKSTIGEELELIYRRYPNEAAVGIFKLGQPVLLLRDADLAAAVLVKEFRRFHDNDYYINKFNDPISAKNPFFVPGHSWKPLRSVLAAPVTPGKLKRMIPGDMVAACESMIKYLALHQEKPIEIKRTVGYFTMDTTAKCAFGLQWNSFFDSDVGFRRTNIGDLTGTSFWSNLAILGSVLNFKWLVDTFRLSLTPKEVKEFLVGMVKEVVNFRIENKVTIQDYMQQLIDSEIGGDLNNCTEETYLGVASHCMTFFLDAFETSGIALAYAILELAAHPDAQCRLAEEVEDALGDRHLNELSYGLLNSMEYLDMVVTETLRLHPPLQTITRVCTEDTILKSEKSQFSVRLSKGTPIAIPVSALHTDPKYYPRPEDFEPERFAGSGQRSQEKFAYLPFGEGPRKCTGAQFAIAQIKMALVAISREFKFEIGAGTTRPIPLDPNSCFLHTPKNGIWITFVKKVASR